MVDHGLKELMRQLPVEVKAELRSILDDELAQYVSPELAARLDSRWAAIMANTSDYVSIDEDERELRTRLEISRRRVDQL